MDRGRFDALARLVSRQQSRRAALVAILGTVVFGHVSDPIAGRPKRKRRDKGKNTKRDRRRKDRKRGGGRSRANQQNRKRKQAASGAGVEAVPANCCSRHACTPGPGKNLADCCFAGAALAGQNFRGANLDHADFRGALLTDANFAAANLDATCLVDADVAGARFPGANTGTAIVCRTRTSRGVDDSGCGRGTPCCPTCDAAHPCNQGQACCDGRCVAGECCTNAECPIEVCRQRACAGHRCVSAPVRGEPGPGCQTVCCEDAQGEPVCCQGVKTCDASGACCAPEPRDQACGVGTSAPKCGVVTNNCDQPVDCGPCAERICRDGTCTGQNNTCAYTPVFGTTGSGCGTVCCRDAQGAPECCAAGVTRCFPSGQCRCAGNAECPAGDICCDGACEGPIWANETTFGTGPGNASDQFNRIIGIAVSADERTAWIVDQPNSRVSVWSRQSNGQWANEALFGSSGSGLGQFNIPFGVAVSDDGLTAFVGDQGSIQTLQGSRVSVWRKQPNGSWTNPFSLGNGTGDGADQFEFPTGVAVSGDGRTLWVVDTGNSRISVWRESNGNWAPLTTFGVDGEGPGQFSDPVGVAVSGDGQTAWVVDRINTRVSVWTQQANGNWIFDTEFGSFGDRADQWRGPRGVAVSADGRRAFVADPGLRHHRISIWTRQASGDWAHELNVGNGQGSGQDQFNGPAGLAVSADGQTFWVSDAGNHRVSIWSLSGCLEPDG